MRGYLLLPLLGMLRGAVVVQQSDTAAVRRVVEAVAAFSEAKNPAGLDTLFAGDPWVQIIEGAGVNVGWADYRDHHLKPEMAEMEHFSYRFFEIVPQVRGGMAWAPFRYELTTDTPQRHVEVEGRGTAVLEKRGGRWLVVHLHTSGGRKSGGQ